MKKKYISPNSTVIVLSPEDSILAGLDSSNAFDGDWRSQKRDEVEQSSIWDSMNEE